MKRSTFFAVSLFAIATWLAACSENGVQDSVNPEGAGSTSLYKPPPPPPPPPANPAIVFKRPYTVFSQGGYSFVVPALWVMNADGTNQTKIYAKYIFNGRNSSTNSYEVPLMPAWSANGQHICFSLLDNSPHRDLYTMDISVVNGIPTGSNVMKIFDAHASNGRVGSAVWSPTANEIAMQWLNNTDPPKILVIPATGGMPAPVYTSVSRDYGITRLSYSPDGSRIAFGEHQISTGYNWLKVVERSTGMVTASIAMNQFNTIYRVDWSRFSGSTHVVFDAGSVASSAADSVFVIDVSSATVPTFLKKGEYPSWSPDDSKIVFVDAGWNGSAYYNNGIKTFTLLGGSTSTLTTGSSDDSPDWKR